MSIAIGELTKLPFQSMSLDSSHSEWVNSIKYSGVTLCGGKSLRFDNNIVKQNFFAACNCVYTHAKHLDEVTHAYPCKRVAASLSSHAHLGLLGFLRFLRNKLKKRMLAGTLFSDGFSVFIDNVSVKGFILVY
jgi:hypothetical protein